tara:strand:- start:612 stop:821 length:210 start_codon:yes stop_codon:yes gene_type:complete
MTKEQIKKKVSYIANSNTTDQLKATLQYYETTLARIIDRGNHRSEDYYQELIQQHREALSLRIEIESNN